MKALKQYLFLIAIAFFISGCDILQEVVQTIEENTDIPLTEQEVVRGLKEALQIGTNNSVNIVSALNGYYGDQLIKISLPPEAKIIMDNKDNPMLKAIGITDQIDKSILSINRAAENAAKSATPIFANAIKSMSIQDAFSILNGSDTAATHYFRQKTYQKLKSSFKPKIKNSLNQKLVGNISANSAWSNLTDAYNKVAPFAGWNKVNTQLDDYVTRKALNGLFIKIQNEEKQIRQNPSARVSDILKRVFGK